MVKYFNGRDLLLTLACELRVSPFIGLIVVLYLAFWLWRLGYGRVAEAKSSRIKYDVLYRYFMYPPDKAVKYR